MRHAKDGSARTKITLSVTFPNVAPRAPFRTGRNVLGVAVQLCTLPWLGFVPDEVAAAPAAAVGSVVAAARERGG